MKKLLIGALFTATATLIPVADAFAKAGHHLRIYNPRFH